MKLGATYRDNITGFQGVATGHCEYISGCNQTLLTPPVDEKGAHREPHWFDDQRLELRDGCKVVSLNNDATPGCDKEAPKR
jgi:hypothetical protein